MRKYLPWLAVLLILVVGFGTIYGAVQQAQRSDANMPQIQMAEDTATSLNKGDIPAVLVGPPLDIAKSLAPFTIIYDKTGRVVLGSGYLNGKVPKVDVGLLKDAHGKDYNAVTWQPQKDVRIAAVAVESNKYYVFSGRNLKEVEKNENKTFELALIGGLISFVLFWVIFLLSNSNGDSY